jgi:L-fuculose-phosphate aldolase
MEDTAKNDISVLAETLSLGCKVLGYQGQTDVIWGHVSLRIPGTDTFLMKAANLGLEEAEADNMVIANLDGEQVGGTGKIHSEVPIHSEILRARPEINCVVHTHPKFATVFASLGKELLPVNHEATLFCDGLPVYTATTDLIREKSRGEELAACLGDKYAVLMRNHGITTAGTSVGEAVMIALILDKACEMQLLATQFGGPVYWTDPEEAAVKKKKIYGTIGDGKLDRAFQFYVRQVKRMEKAQGGIF